MAFIALSEIGGCVLRPLVGLGEQDASGKLLVDVLAEFAEEGVGFGEVFAGVPSRSNK